jgi:HSP20 family protein
MARLAKHQVPVVEPTTRTEPVDLFGPIDRAFDRMFGVWLTGLPLRHPVAAARQWMADAFIPVDEFHQDGSLVIRAEVPGIDPDKDVELTVSKGLLHISVDRHEDETVKEEHYIRQEMRYGAFERTIPLPKGVSESDVKATYHDGILEIRVPQGEPDDVAKVPISKG